MSLAGSPDRHGSNRPVVGGPLCTGLGLKARVKARTTGNGLPIGGGAAFVTFLGRASVELFLLRIPWGRFFPYRPSFFNRFENNGNLTNYTIFISKRYKR
uniref:Uncharacterized protein n=1 Tax=Arundo donax TaxID=35708 RepID=A0A0A9HKN7_ARUDO